MGDIDLVVTRSKRLEHLLEGSFGARGKGLHQKVGSVADRLDAATVKRLRFVATMRNKLVHEDGVDRLDDRRGFLDACDRAEKELRRAAGLGWGAGLRRVAIRVALVGLALVLLYVWLFS